jgi:hypothetical protein
MFLLLNKENQNKDEQSVTETHWPVACEGEMSAFRRSIDGEDDRIKRTDLRTTPQQFEGLTAADVPSSYSYYLTFWRDVYLDYSSLPDLPPETLSPSLPHPLTLSNEQHHVRILAVLFSLFTERELGAESRSCWEITLFYGMVTFHKG